MIYRARFGLETTFGGNGWKRSFQSDLTIQAQTCRFALLESPLDVDWQIASLMEKNQSRKESSEDD
jgi:hypothetical protein